MQLRLVKISSEVEIGDEVEKLNSLLLRSGGWGWCGEMEIKANLSQSLVEVEAELGNFIACWGKVKDLTHADRGGVQNGQKNADVLNERALTLCL